MQSEQKSILEEGLKLYFLVYTQISWLVTHAKNQTLFLK